MRQMGLCPPIELAPIPNPAIDQVPEEDEDEEEVPDTDIEVRELTEGRQNLLVPPSRWFANRKFLFLIMLKRCRKVKVKEKLKKYEKAVILCLY